MKPPPTWSVPIASIGCATTVRIDKRGNVELWTPNSTVGPDTMTPTEACQLGQALLDASREAAARRKP